VTDDTVQALLTAATRTIAGEEARRDAELLLLHVLSRPRAWLYAHAGDLIDAESAQRFRTLVTRRARGEPMAYITGARAFWSLDLAVTPDVLVPRAETELLVELALQRIDLQGDVDVADLGTGSGAIALAIAHERPRARVLATDASETALAVARANAAKHGLRNVTFASGDWCAALGTRQFGVIVSNPPYIADEDAHLAQGDLRFEPRTALASGSDGLDAIRAIARHAPEHLHHAGWLLLEHGFEQGPAVRDVLQKSGFVELFTARDLENRDRVSGGRAGA